MGASSSKQPAPKFEIYQYGKPGHAIAQLRLDSWTGTAFGAGQDHVSRREQQLAAGPVYLHDPDH